jgi:hypothetical protein
MSVQYGGDKITFSDGSTVGNGWSGFKNRLINSDMRIDQRNAGASVTVGTGAFGVDRFRSAEVTDGTATVQQSTVAPNGFSNSLLYTVTGTDASLGSTQYASIGQRIEGFNIADLGWGTASASPITISFWVRSSVTGTYCVGLYNSGGARSYTAEYTINVADTWEQKTITVVGDTTGTWLTNNGIGVALSFTLAVGSSYQQTAGSWGSTAFAIGTSNQTNLMATSGATFYITGVQLEKGSTATSFDYRPYGAELQLCQRYYQLVKPTLAISADSSSNTILIGAVSFPIQMRATPTVSQSGVFNYETPFGISRAQSSVSVSLTGPTSNNVGCAYILDNFSSLTFQRTYRPDGNTNSLLFSAEL